MNNTTRKRNFFISYFGSKSKEYKFIKDYIPKDIKTFVEPFCGSCSTSFQHYLENPNISYNLSDIDKTLIPFIKHMSHYPLWKEVVDLYNKIIVEPPSRDEWSSFLKIVNDNGEPWSITKSIIKYILCHASGQHINEYPISKNGIMFKKFIPIKYETYSENRAFFNSPNVSLETADFKVIFERYRNDETAFIYLDPPYFNSCNKTYSGYENVANSDNVINDNTTIFIDILEFLKTCKCRVVMIINDNSINRYLYKDFIKFSYPKKYGLSRLITNHLVIANYQF
jgi:site-specific DNA-adenine methylase